MNAGIPIILEKQQFFSHEIAQYKTIEALPDYEKFSPYSQQTLAFCHAWLTGQSTFQIHTSGSTGIPKPIHITREQMQASAQATATALNLQAGDQALVCLNTGYIAGKMMLVRGLELNMPLHIIPPSSLPLENLEGHVDFTALVPLQLKSMLDANGSTIIRRLNAMKAIIIGGAPVSYGLEEQIRKMLSTAVYSTYGMTETVSHIALRKLNGTDASDVYTILPGVEVSQDERACLSIKGKVSNQQWLQTNDIVEILDANHFRWLGRYDNVVNSGGVKLYTDSLEMSIQPAIERLGIAERYFLAGLPDERLGEKLCLILERKEALSPEQEIALTKWMKAHLKAYELPKQIIHIHEFVLSPSGKIRRKPTLNLV